MTTTGWDSVIESNAASELTATRLVDQLQACQVSALAFCRLLERWGRGDAVPATAGKRQAALRRAADRVETALAGLERPLSRSTSSSSSPSGRRPLVVPRPGSRRARRVAPGTRPSRRPRVPEPCRCGLPGARRPRSRARRSGDRGESRGDAGPVLALGRPVRPAGHASRLDRGRPARARGLTPRISVVGSVNLDLVARAERLPRAGETVSGATFARVPGGKGANQAVACARLGADVTFVGAVGDDAFAEDATRGLREEKVTLRLQTSRTPTGVALILVDAGGETEIVVAPGANGALAEVELPDHDAVLCQLEIPDAAVSRRGSSARALLPQRRSRRPISVDPDLCVVNRYELESLSRRDGLVAVTLGAEGAILLEDGEEVARATPPASTSSTEPRRATPSRPACSSRSSRVVTRRRRSRERALRALSQRRGSALSPRCPPQTRSRRSSRTRRVVERRDEALWVRRCDSSPRPSPAGARGRLPAPGAGR